MTTTALDWAVHNKARASVEHYYQKHSKAGNLNIPKYDLFVTELRKDFEKAGYDLADEADLFKLWGALQVNLEAGAFVCLEELGQKRELAQAAIHTWAIFGSMSGLFLREMTKNCPNIPAIEEAASE